MIQTYPISEHDKYWSWLGLFDKHGLTLSEWRWGILGRHHMLQTYPISEHDKYWSWLGLFDKHGIRGYIFLADIPWYRHTPSLNMINISLSYCTVVSTVIYAESFDKHGTGITLSDRGIGIQYFSWYILLHFRTWCLSEMLHLALL